MWIAVGISAFIGGIFGLIVYAILRFGVERSRLEALFYSMIAWSILGALAFLIFFRPWAFVQNYELGYIFDSRDGTIKLITHNGYVKREPIFQSVYTIDLRPRQVCINVGGGQGTGEHEYNSGVNQRVLNCKLVRFNPKGLALFISWHGANDYYDQTLDDLLKIYAYDGSGRAYPFLDVLRELKNDNGDATPQQVVAK